MPRIVPPKPAARPDDAGLLARVRLFRRDMFRSQPARLYHAKMAAVRTPIRSSFFLNTPALVRRVLEERPEDFPKADLIGRTLKGLLGRSVFVTNGAEWRAQRRIIDPAFEAGRLRDSFPAMHAAGAAALARLRPGETEIEFETAHLAADVIFRTLFSIPITHAHAAAVFSEFRAYQRAQPLLSWRDLLGLPGWIPRRRNTPARQAAAAIRARLGALVEARAAEIAAGTAPDDLATKIMTTPDPETGALFSTAEMIDQVAIFFLAGHETSASALSWALYCLAADPEAQAHLAAEIRAIAPARPFEFSDIPKLRFARDTFREVLRLYPPVPMMVRQNTRPETYRGQDARPGSLAILSPWHLHRHQEIWDNPDHFDPWRWQQAAARECARSAYLPFSKGPRVCTGAGFAMVEGVLLLAMLVRAFEFTPLGPPPVPVAHLTLRSETGIHLRLSRRV